MSILTFRTKLLSIFSILIAIYLYLLAYQQSSTVIEESFTEQINNHYDTVYQRLTFFKEQRYELLNTLSNHSSTQNFLLKNEISEIKYLFNDFAQADKLIMQMRILNLEGKEILRLNQNNNTIDFVPNDLLQNKNHRYYFQQFKKLSKDEMGISYIDLNIEQQKIERPFKATVRLGMPIVINNQKRAILIINYDMNKFLNQVFTSSFFRLYLIDDDHYFITHDDPKYQWSKYKEHQTTIEKYFTEEEKKTLIIKKLNIWGNYYALVYNTNKNQSIVKFIDISQGIGLIIFLASFLLLAPFIYILIIYLKRLQQVNNNLTSSNSKISAILNNTSDTIILIDDKGIIKEVNKTIEKTFGYTKEELINKNINMLVPDAHKHKHDGYIKGHDGSFEDKVINQNRELYGLHKDGTLVNIHLTVTKVEINRAMFFIGTVQNLTDNIKNKKLFEHVFNLSSVGIALVLEDGSFWRINQKLCDTLEYSHNELLKMKLAQVTLDEDLYLDENKINKILQNQINSYTVHKRFITKFDKTIHVKLTITGVFIDENKQYFDYFIVIIDDITEQLDTQNKLQEAEAIAQMGHWHWDMNKNQFKWSKNMMAIFGKLNEKRLLDYNDFILSVKEQDKQMVNDAFNHSLINHEELDITFDIVVNGDLKTIHTKGSITYKNEIAIEFFGTCQDITAIAN